MPKTEMRMGRELSIGAKVQGEDGYYVVELSPAAKSGMCLARTPNNDFTQICSVMDDLPYPVLIERTTEDRIADGIDAAIESLYGGVEPQGFHKGRFVERITYELNADD